MKETPPPTSTHPLSRRNVTIVTLAIVLSFSVTGFFVALRQTQLSAEALKKVQNEKLSSLNSSPPLVESDGILTAVPYRQIPEATWGPNARAFSDEKDIPHVTPNLQAPISYTDKERSVAVSERVKRRAYDGAPPLVPHSIDTIKSDGCYTCHSSSAKVGDKVAPVMSHPRYSNCTQCHAQMPQQSTAPGEADSKALAGNDFQGIPTRGKGDRAFKGAPPVIPHTTLMRENCSSCHGANGLYGLRTTHPARQNCQQCHASSANQDQRMLTQSWTPLPDLNSKSKPQ